MATIGQPLTAPEAGWRRYDDADSRILAYGNTGTNKQDTGFYNNYSRWLSDTSSSSFQFKFYGSKLRILGCTDYNRRADKAIVVEIDGVRKISYSQYSAHTVYRSLEVDISNLEAGIHTVRILNAPDDNLDSLFVLDAIDIDSNGYLLLQISVNLTATADDSKVILSWDAVTGVTSYNVKRATTAGGPYTTIANNVTTTSYVDTDVVNGTYYYVVTAITVDGESANSNEASATPVEEGGAVLQVTMIDSSEREYQLTTTEIDSFINWINNHTSGDPASYMLNKNVGLHSSKEYLLFDKIISFEVTELK